MSDQRAIVAELADAARSGEPVTLASVVRTVGSAYRGVGTRMVVREGGRAAGLVSGGCLEADLVARAARLAPDSPPALVTYDSRSPDDLVWGLGLGCDGLLEVLLERLAPERAATLASLLARAHAADEPTVAATVIRSGGAGTPAVGARLFVSGDAGTDPVADGDWGAGPHVALAATDAAGPARGAWRGLVRDYPAAAGDGAVQVAFEVITPPVRFVVCGSGPDAAPVARLAAGLGWEVTVVDDRPPSALHAERFPGLRVAECRAAERLGEALPLGPRTAAVVMSHHFERDTDYLAALLDAGAGYVGVLGPRIRTTRMLDALAARGRPIDHATLERVYGPVGLDVGGEGPEAIALAIVAEVSAVAGGRSGGHLRSRHAPIHGPGPWTPPEVQPAGPPAAYPAPGAVPPGAATPGA